VEDQQVSLSVLVPQHFVLQSRNICFCVDWILAHCSSKSLDTKIMH
jgi:hypothetical protein